MKLNRDHGMGRAAWLALAAALVAGGCILFPEEEFTGDVVPNDRPAVRITGGVLEDGVDAEARVHFYWAGADNDGVVRWFEWAIDDTISESAWNRTTRFDEVISFPATENTGDNEIFSDWHTFYVRSVDDDFQRSAPDKRFFNAQTIAPVTSITQPEPQESARWASTLKVSWLGVDDDGSRADNLPSRFQLKLVKVPTSIQLDDQEALLRVFADSTNLLRAIPIRSDFPPDDDELYNKARRKWQEVPGTVSEYWLENMEVYQRYGFIIKAIDEAGAEEQEFARNRNYVIFTVDDRRINVILFEPALGNRQFNTAAYPPEPWEVTVAPDQPIRFQWIGDASLSGTESGPSNYGFDIPDPDDESFRSIDGRGGWIGWATRTRMQEAISFSAEGPDVHYFYLKMRDVSNNPATETRCAVKINVAEFSFDKPFLIVDDLRYAPKNQCGGPLLEDEETDLWRLTYDQATGEYSGVFSGVRDFMRSSDRVDYYAVYPDNEANKAPNIESEFLDVLGRYQTVIWDCGHDQPTGLRQAAGVNQYLSAYVGLGGNLLLYTFIGPAQTIAGLIGFDNPDPKCPRENDFQAGYYWNRLSFLWQYLNLTGCIDKPRGATTQGNPDEALRVAIAENPVYPDLFIDTVRWPCARGIMNYEALVSEVADPDVTPWYELQEGMDIIYRARTRVPDEFSDLEGKPIAWRTYPLAGEDTDRGRIVCFSFHPYFFEEAAVGNAMTNALHWLVNGSDF